MASIYKRKNKDGTSCWRAVVRIKGHPSVCNHFDRKQEAEDWSHDVERKIKQEQFKFDQHNTAHTFEELADRFINNGALEHHRSSKDILRHIAYWKLRFTSYALVHFTPEFIGKERLLILETPSSTGKKRATATANRYISALSSLFSYAVKDLRWINENPCQNLKKLKENPGRDRVLSEEEMIRLLSACRASKSPYLYCIVLISLTTGARQGETLKLLEWRDIDFKNKLASLKESKNGRPRSISFAPEVIDELQRLYKSCNPDKPLVFASRTAFGKIDIKKAWKEALKRAGISCRAHDMRHSFATMAASQGATNLELATAMGHRTLEMLQRYTH